MLTLYKPLIPSFLYIDINAENTFCLLLYSSVVAACIRTYIMCKLHVNHVILITFNTSVGLAIPAAIAPDDTPATIFSINVSLPSTVIITNIQI